MTAAETLRRLPPCRQGYLSELPAREYLPMFWTSAEQALLQGTERADAPEEDARLTAEDFEEAVAPLVARHPGRLSPGAFTLQGFRAAASWVASRAFGVDSFHGGGPLGPAALSPPEITCRVGDLPVLHFALPRDEI